MPYRVVQLGQISVSSDSRGQRGLIPVCDIGSKKTSHSSLIHTYEQAGMFVYFVNYE